MVNQNLSRHIARKNTLTITRIGQAWTKFKCYHSLYCWTIYSLNSDMWMLLCLKIPIWQHIPSISDNWYGMKDRVPKFIDFWKGGWMVKFWLWDQWWRVVERNSLGSRRGERVEMGVVRLWMSKMNLLNLVSSCEHGGNKGHVHLRRL